MKKSIDLNQRLFESARLNAQRIFEDQLEGVRLELSSKLKDGYKLQISQFTEEIARGYFLDWVKSHSNPASLSDQDLKDIVREVSMGVVHGTQSAHKLVQEIDLEKAREGAMYVIEFTKELPTEDGYSTEPYKVREDHLELYLEGVLAADIGEKDWKNLVSVMESLAQVRNENFDTTQRSVVDRFLKFYTAGDSELRKILLDWGYEFDDKGEIVEHGGFRI